MKLQKGDIYICTEPCCRAEIEVRRSADNSCPAGFTLRCCCGHEMVHEYMLVRVEASDTFKSANRELLPTAR
jgi:hypothetical protein